MKNKSKYLFSLSLVFLIVSVPFGQSAVSVEVGDKVEMTYTTIDFQGSVNTTTSGNISHVVAGVIPGETIVYSANHTKEENGTTYPGVRSCTVSNVSAMSLFTYTQAEIDAMYNAEKEWVADELYNYALDIIENGTGLIVSEGLNASFTFTYTLHDVETQAIFNAIWANTGRLLYYYIDLSQEMDFHLRRVIEEKPAGEVEPISEPDPDPGSDPDPNPDADPKPDGNISVPGFPIEVFLGVSVLSAAIAIKKFKKRA
jgi:hypothetical protein